MFTEYGDHQSKAADPPAASKLDRRTFLINHTQFNSRIPPSDGSRWSIKAHDFGKQWFEASWGKIDSHRGKKGFKGKSTNKEQNEKRARARAAGEIRRKCLSIGADYLVTLTYRGNAEDRIRVMDDLTAFRRMLSRCGYPMPYVMVLECQKRGANHPHLAVHGFQDIRLLPLLVQDYRKGTESSESQRAEARNAPVKLARYLSKYIRKDQIASRGNLRGIGTSVR